jgi:ABC-type bacteriocin/lantibiotic exporter with double-glycine peptidase domain
VAQRLGAAVSVEGLRRRAAPGPDGLNLRQLRQLAGEVGLPCLSARVSVERLGQVSLPAVAHLSDGHYVVLHELARAASWSPTRRRASSPGTGSS